MESQGPIFIHSMFRTGSTYLFKVFRRCQSRYHCYYEPLNEIFHLKRHNPEVWNANVSKNHNTVPQLRHPDLDKPYFSEMAEKSEIVSKLFQKEFSYDHFFGSNQDEADKLRHYFISLSAGDEQQPVFSCCRTAGRIHELKLGCNDKHIFLWRNPRDQWWSNKVGHFDAYYQLISQAPNAPAILKETRNRLGVSDVSDDEWNNPIGFYLNRPLERIASYELFYTIWCLIMIKAPTLCDITISIDLLSSTPKYSTTILDLLEEDGIAQLSFHDCSISLSSYHDTELAFFMEIEARVEDNLLAHNYDIANIHNAFESVDNALMAGRKALQDKGIEKGLRDVILLKENELKRAKAELKAVYSSRSWKITAPLRWLNSQLRSFSGKKQARCQRE